MAALLDIDRLADAEAHLKGEVPVAGMPRLAELDADAAQPVDAARAEPCGVASYRLEFGRDRRGRATASGQVETAVGAVCQRCLEPMRLALKVDVDVVFVRPGRDATAGLEQRDWIELERTSLKLTAFLEEELLLGIPAVTRHEDADCAGT